MTIKQALIATVNYTGVDDNLVEKTLLDNDLTGSDEYSKDKKKPVDLCTISVLLSEMQKASMSEGGLSVSFNFEACRTNVLMLAKANTGEPIADDAISLYGERNAIKSPSRW